MFTPNQLDEVSFAKVVLGGYDMRSVDGFLGNLIGDYNTIYTENSNLKSKLRVLVKKLEEYRKAENDMNTAISNTRRTCDQMLLDTEAKCARMLAEANQAAEQIRNEAIQQAATGRITELQNQMHQWIEVLENVKSGAIDTAPEGESEKPGLTGKPSVDRPWMKFYPPGADQMTVPEVTMNEYMRMMSRGDDLTVMHYYGTDISWKEFFQMVHATALAMKAAGLLD